MVLVFYFLFWRIVSQLTFSGTIGNGIDRIIDISIGTSHLTIVYGFSDGTNNIQKVDWYDALQNISITLKNGPIGAYSKIT